MTGQARVLIRDYGTDIRVQCWPCGIDSPSIWPGAKDDVRDHNRTHHQGDA